METNVYKKKVKILSIIFLVIFIVINILANVYVIIEFKYNRNPIQMLSPYQLVSVLPGLVIYIPLMLTIRRYARLAEMKKAVRVSTGLLCYLFAAEAMAIIATVVEIVKRFS